MPTADRFSRVITHHGEGPVWDARSGTLRIVDLMAGDLVDVDGGGLVVGRRNVGAVATAWRPRRAGGMVVAGERGFLLVEDGGRIEQLPEVWADPAVRMNDGATSPDGSFYCGSMAYAETDGAGRLYRLDPDLSVHVVLTGVTISNGLAWEPAGGFAYYIDTPTQRIDRLYLDGEIRREPWVEVDQALGSPDGLTVDADGGVWVALWGGHAVHRYDDAGRLDVVVGVDAAQVTACTFGGPTLDRLMITTSREDLGPGEDPAAGSLFVLETGTHGLPPPAFAG